ncbi:MAG: transcription antitermination factor NusB [Eubacteriales bacterium]
MPLRVSVNEAVELAKQYDDEKAYGFVNGILNSLLHDERAVGEK